MHRNRQSTKPFHAETDARLTVSTVPPMTTSFCVAKTVRGISWRSGRPHQGILNRIAIRCEWRQQPSESVHCSRGADYKRRERIETSAKVGWGGTRLVLYVG